MDSKLLQKKKTILKGEVFERLILMVAMCDAANLKEVETLTKINSGVLGFKKRTPKEIKNEEQPKPITITRSTYYKYKKEILSLEFQTQYMKQSVKGKCLKSLIMMKPIVEDLQSRSFRNISYETDPMRTVQVISHITRNIPYFLNYSDFLRRIIEEKIPKKEK